jgi:hypothetical protein
VRGDAEIVPVSVDPESDPLQRDRRANVEAATIARSL